jgi:hypothetical protein
VALGAGGALLLRPKPPADRAPDPAPSGGSARPSTHEVARTQALTTVAPEVTAPGPEPQGTPPVAAEAHEETSHAREAPAGALTVNATPWAAVRVDGRAVGNTPRRSMSIPAGAHQLTLECPPLGRSARVPIRVGPGASVRVLADLSVDPPRVVVR